MKKRRIPEITLIAGVILYLFSLWNPFPLSSGLQWGGLIGIFMLPPLGVIGTIYAVIQKKKWLILGNVILILALPLSMLFIH